MKRAAERRYKMKYALPRLFEKYPWLETYLREVRRAEELGFPYVPDIVVRDPATAKIEIRRPPPTRWIIPQRQPQIPELPQVQQPEPPQQIRQPQIEQPVVERTRELAEPEESEEGFPLLAIIGEIWILLKSLSIEQTHQLFRIIAESKGYRRLTVRAVASQLGLDFRKLHRYMTRGMPRRTREFEEFRRKILEIPSRELKYNTENLISILRSLAETYTETQQQAETIIRMILGIEEEEEEQAQEETQQQEQQKTENTNSNA